MNRAFRKSKENAENEFESIRSGNDEEIDARQDEDSSKHLVDHLLGEMARQHRLGLVQRIRVGAVQNELVLVVENHSRARGAHRVSERSQIWLVFRFGIGLLCFGERQRFVDRSGATASDEGQRDAERCDGEQRDAERVEEKSWD